MGREGIDGLHSTLCVFVCVGGGGVSMQGRAEHTG